MRFYFEFRMFNFEFIFGSCLKIFYSLPLTSVNGEIKKLDLALAKLFRRKFRLKPLVLSIIALTKVDGNELIAFDQISMSLRISKPQSHISNLTSQIF